MAGIMATNLDLLGIGWIYSQMARKGHGSGQRFQQDHGHDRRPDGQDDRQRGQGAATISTAFDGVDRRARLTGISRKSNG